MKKMKTSSLLIFCCLIYTGIFSQQYYRYNEAIVDPNKITFADSSYNFVTDSLEHNVGLVPQNDARLTKYFKYIGNEGIYIKRIFSGDPHYICEYPKEELIPGKIYSFEVCFSQKNRPGVFNKSMGFLLSDDSRIVFRFKGTVMSDMKLDETTPNQTPSR